MRLHRFLLRPLAPWATPLRSDTLYGLLLWRIAERQGDEACRHAITAFLEGKPPFVLSSALPEGSVFAPRLPPVPRARFRQWVEERAIVDAAGAPLSLMAALQAFKRFRKQTHLPLADWQKLAGALSVRRLFAAFCSRSAPERHSSVPDGSVEPHVSIDRRSGSALEGGLYFNRLRWFRQDARLHLYARTDSPETLLSLLAEAGELGFGKDAALGKGRFAVQADTDFRAGTLDNDGPSSLLLSVCAAPDMAALQGWYATEIKRGKVWGGGSPFKNPLLLLSEGSLLHRLPDGPFVLQHIHPHARIVQITHPLTLPCRMAEEV